MEDNKLIDLHKVAGLFREIQTEEFAKEEAKQESEFKNRIKEMEKSVEEEISEELTAAQKKLPAGLRDAIAKKQGDSADDKDDKEETEEEVEENINELNVPNDLEKVKAQMAKLKQMASDAQAKGDHNQAYNIERSSEMLALQKKLSKLGGDIDEEVDEEGSDTTLSDILKAAGVKVVTDADLNQAEAQPVEEDRSDVTHAQLVPHIKNVKAAMIRHAQEDPEEAREFIEHLDDMMTVGDVEVVDMMQPDWMDTEARDSLIGYFEVSISQDPALYNMIFPGEDIKWAQGQYKEMFEGKPVEEEAVTEEPVAENPEMVAMDTNTLQQILNLAGVKPVTDADINQPEPVEEYSNSPDEEYADADTQLNKMSGGINRPKAMPAVGNQGHNDLVTKLKKAYDSRDL